MRFEFVMTKCYRWRYKLAEVVLNLCQVATCKISSTFTVRSSYGATKLTLHEDIYPCVLSSKVFANRVTLS
jgi:hypothetical protein